MFNNMMMGVKRRILKEVEDAFNSHPVYAGNVRVVNKFPQKERVQYGVVLRNTSGSQIRMSADNYMADLYSHVRLCKVRTALKWNIPADESQGRAQPGNCPGTSVEWVRENTNDITDYIQDEDLTSQVNPTQRIFTVSRQMLAGPGNTDYADSPGQITVLLNGSAINPLSVDGYKKIFLLSATPTEGDTIKVSYYYRKLAPPGYYVLDFVTNNSFVVNPAYVLDKEILIECTTGLETSVTLGSASIPGTGIFKQEEIYLEHRNLKQDLYPVLLTKGVDYSIDYSTGIVTFLSPPGAQPNEPGFRMLADYRYYLTADNLGTFPFTKFQEIHNAIPGVVICIGRRAVKDDQQVIVVSQSQEQQAQIYGGHWGMSLSLGVIAKDTPSMEEMTDLIVNYLWGVRKNQLEYEGITLNSVEATGENEEAFVENTGDLYYESSIDISVQTEWQRFVPYIYKIRHVNIDVEPDMGVVLKAPVIGYERVS